MNQDIISVLAVDNLISTEVKDMAKTNKARKLLKIDGCEQLCIVNSVSMSAEAFPGKVNCRNKTLEM